MNRKPKLKSALSDSVGICELCKQNIISEERGYIEYYAVGNKVYHKECLGKSQGKG